MGTECSGKCGTMFLVAINSLFMLFGIGCLIIGIIMRVDGDTLYKDEVLALMNEVSLNGTFKLGNVINSLSVIMICLGIFIVLVSMIGIAGACLKNRCLLITYATIVIIVLMLQIVAVVLWFTIRDKIKDHIDSELEAALVDYEGETSDAEVSTGWNLFFTDFECCGVEPVSNGNSQEFSKSKWWQNRADTNNKVPKSCCKGANKNNYKSYPNEAACQQTLETHNEKGCSETFEDWLAGYQTAAIVTGAILVVIEIIGIVAAFLVCRAIGKNNMVV